MLGYYGSFSGIRIRSHAKHPKTDVAQITGEIRKTQGRSTLQGTDQHNKLNYQNIN